MPFGTPIRKAFTAASTGAQHAAVALGKKLGELKTALAPKLTAAKNFVVNEVFGKRPLGAGTVPCPKAPPKPLFDNAVVQSAGGGAQVLYGKVEGSADKAQRHVAASAGAGVVKLEGVGQAGVFGGAGQLNVLSGSASGEAGAKYGAGAKGSVSASAVEGGVSGFVGYDRNNPLAELGGGVQVGVAEASGNVLAGDDGRRVGLAVGGGASAAVVSGGGTAELNFRIGWLPFVPPGCTVSIRAKATGSALSVGGAAEAHAYYDKVEKRAHAGGAVDMSFLLGVGLGLDVSVGKAYGSRDRREVQ